MFVELYAASTRVDWVVGIAEDKFAIALADCEPVHLARGRSKQDLPADLTFIDVIDTGRSVGRARGRRQGDEHGWDKPQGSAQRPNAAPACHLSRRASTSGPSEASTGGWLRCIRPD